MPAQIDVTTTADTVADDGFCSLREAVISASDLTASSEVGECELGTAGADVINISVAGPIGLTASLPDVRNHPLTIEGNGVVIDGNLTGTMLRSFSDLDLRNLTMTNGGGADANGGALYLGGGATTTLNNVGIINNQATEGGGIRLDGASLNVTNGSTIARNTASRFGGGGISATNLLGAQATVTITDSTIEQNRSDLAVGGGIRLHPGTIAVIERTIIRANTQPEFLGGGIWNQGDLTLTDTRFEDNDDGLHNRGQATALRTTFVNNRVALSNTDGVFTGTQVTMQNNQWGALWGTLELTDSYLLDNRVGVQLIDQLTLTATTIASSNSDPSWGILLDELNDASIVNSTISGNADFSAIRLAGDATAEAIHSTFLGGSSTSDQSELRIGASFFERLADTSGGALDRFGTSTIDSLGYNIVGITNDAGAFGPTDLTGVVEPLEPLAVNDGGTQPTHAITAGSRARDFVKTTILDGSPLPTVDQNGTPRPAGVFADAGAYEAPGAPVAFCAGRQVTWFVALDGNRATSGDDVILGTPGNDFIDAGNGDDVICGEGGDDQIFGSLGNDFIFGGEGDDRLWGNDGNDRVRGQQGNDEILGEDGNDFLYGGIGDDVIRGGRGNDTIGGFGGADEIFGGEGDDTIWGGFGADRVLGEAGADTIFGLVGNDVLAGGPGNDIVNGDAGDDSIAGDTGDDIVSGGNGPDIVRGDAGNDVVNGGRGDDRLEGGPGDADVCTGNKGTDVATDTCEQIFGVP
jgi:CSLREA domain-containing protein